MTRINSPCHFPWDLLFLLGGDLLGVNGLVGGFRDGVFEVMGLREKSRGGEAERGLLNGDPMGGT